MGTRPTTWVAWLLWATIVIFGATLLDLPDVLYVWHMLTNYFWSYPDLYGEDLVSSMMVLAVPAYATVGAVIASLRPSNGIGWLCLFFSLLLLSASWQPTDVALMDRMRVLQDLGYLLLIPPLPLTLMLLIFPDGRPLSRRWWAVAAPAGAGTILVALTGFSRPTPPLE